MLELNNHVMVKAKKTNIKFFWVSTYICHAVQADIFDCENKNLQKFTLAVQHYVLE